MAITEKGRSYMFNNDLVPKYGDRSHPQKRMKLIWIMVGLNDTQGQLWFKFSDILPKLMKNDDESFSQ